MSIPEVVIATCKEHYGLYVNGDLIRQWRNAESDTEEFLNALCVNYSTKEVEPRWFDRVGYVFPDNDLDVFWDFH